MDTEINIGIIIKKIRLDKELTLKEVATKANISSSMLSQIEKGGANPSLNTIKAIATVLEVPLFKFFLDSSYNETYTTVLRNSERKKIVSKETQFELISPNTKTDIEFMKMILKEEGTVSSEDPVSHRGEEVALVIKGKAKIIVEHESVELEEGDSVHIPARCKHKWINIGKVPVEVLFAVTPPEF